MGPSSLAPPQSLLQSQSQSQQQTPSQQHQDEHGISTAQKQQQSEVGIQAVFSKSTEPLETKFVSRDEFEKQSRELADALAQLLVINEKNTKLAQQLETKTKEAEATVQALHVNKDRLIKIVNEGLALKTELATKTDHVVRMSEQVAILEQELATKDEHVTRLMRDLDVQHVAIERLTQSAESFELHLRGYQDFVCAAKAFCVQLEEQSRARGVTLAESLTHSDLPSFSDALNIVNALTQAVPMLNFNGGESASGDELVVFQLSPENREYRALIEPGHMPAVLSDENVHSLQQMPSTATNPPLFVVGRFVAREIHKENSTSTALLTVQFVQLDNQRIG
eukprot:c2761_g1_i2.p1 GENE.c2761_g1_i2~~c2761_g1_i2.p1  ORF type:complete len:348 (-),score=115.39 c2761_g1_i2:76-1089(-)